MLQKQLAKHGEYSLAESNRVFDDVVDTIAKAVVKSGKVSIRVPSELPDSMSPQCSIFRRPFLPKTF